MVRRTRGIVRILSIAALVSTTGCGLFQRSGPAAPAELPRKEAPKPPVVLKAAPTVPDDSAGVRVYRAANKFAKTKILVSTEDRWLWYVVGKDTLMSAPVAIGMGRDFTFNGKKFHFATPRGRRTVLKKQENPIWTVPLWHYYERAAANGMKTVTIVAGKKYKLADSTWIEVRKGQVGRVNRFGNFWPFTPGIEIMFDGKVFIPPVNTPQRRVPDALGPAKLDMGDGYLIHGTHLYNENSIGEAVSHGCVRMSNGDVRRLYSLVEPGTPVFIF